MRFVGFDNIKEMFSDVWFTSAVKNNLLFILGTIPVLIMVSMIVATILNNKVYLKNTMRAIVFLPYISSVVAISVVWMKLYNPSKGQINQLLMWLGMDNPPSWLASTTWALPALMLVGIWMGLGYNIVVYMAGLQTIDRALYESAQIDGANGVQMFRHITMPMLSSTTFFLMITNIIGSFQTFGTVNIMTDGGPGKASTVIAQYIYVAGFRYHKMGYAAAMAWVLLIFIFCITLFQWKLQKRYENNF